VSTVDSSTDHAAGSLAGARPRFLAETRRAVADVGPLVAFRAATLRGRARSVAACGVGGIALVTALAAWLPAYLPEGAGRRTDVISLLPSAMVGVVLVAVVSAAASGGGRELVARHQAVAFPVSPTTDHLGALLMAPLNIAWLLQSWTLLGATAYVAGTGPGLVLTQLTVVAWLVAATALAQVVGWALEWLRRGPHGAWAARGVAVAAGAAGAYLVATDRLVPLLQRSPTVHVVVAALQARSGPTVSWWAALGSLLALALVAVVLGAMVAAAVARRPERDELRLESSTHPPRRRPSSDLGAVLRADRAGIWRSVPFRRGLAVLAVMPGLVAIAGNLQWATLTILPGLVASGGALLFGVNAWCIDGRGALWRDSLPADPRLALLSRGLVLGELLVVASLGTVAMAALRAGVPSSGELAAVAATTVVVVLQVVSASLRWSVRRPFPVDLRSARATPAPPLVMVGYSARLALATTSVGICFSVLARVPWGWSPLVALPMALFSLWRLARTAGVWADPQARCRVVATVAS